MFDPSARKLPEVAGGLLKIPVFRSLGLETGE